MALNETVFSPVEGMRDSKKGTARELSALEKKLSGSQARIISITSGKGGVGKTNVSANMGISLAAQGKKVCIFDADLGLANINILLGQQPAFTIEHVLRGEKSISEILVEGPGNIKVVPGGAGIDRLAELPRDQIDNLIEGLRSLEKEFDYILIDTSAGISSTVTSFVLSARDTIIVVSPEPTSLTDAYSLLKTIKNKGYAGNIYVLINMVLSYDDSIKIFNRFNAAAKKYLDADLRYLGYIMMDQMVIASVIQQNPIVLLKPDSTASRCIVSIARKFESIYTGGNEGGENNWRFLEEFMAKEEERAEEEEEGKVITPPREIRESFSRREEGTLEQLEKAVMAHMEKEECTEERARDFIHFIESVFIKRFNKPHYDLKSLLYTSLDLADFSEEKIRELSLILEGIYEKRFKNPLHNVQDLFLKLLEESATEEKIRLLAQNLENRFSRRFNKSLHNWREALRAELEDGPVEEGDFHGLIEEVESIFENRFGKSVAPPAPPFPGQEVEDIFKEMKKGDVELDLLSRKIASLKEERKEVQSRLVKIITDFNKER